MRKIACIILAGCFIVVMGCSHKATDRDPLPIETMKLIVWDLMKADEWHLLRISKDTTLRKTKENIRLFEQVFLVHGITKDRFYNSYRYYEAHPLQMKILIDSVNEFSTRERSRVFDNHGQAH